MAGQLLLGERHDSALHAEPLRGTGEPGCHRALDEPDQDLERHRRAEGVVAQEGRERDAHLGQRLGRAVVLHQPAGQPHAPRCHLAQPTGPLEALDGLVHRPGRLGPVASSPSDLGPLDREQRGGAPREAERLEGGGGLEVLLDRVPDPDDPPDGHAVGEVLQRGRRIPEREVLVDDAAQVDPGLGEVAGAERAEGEHRLPLDGEPRIADPLQRVLGGLADEQLRPDLDVGAAPPDGQHRQRGAVEP